MKIIKPQKLGVLHRTYEDGGQAFFAPAFLVFFPLNATSTLLSEVSLWKFLPTELGKSGALDMGMPKPSGEVLVWGKACTAGAIPQPSCAVRVQLGPVDKTLRVYGRRRWYLGEQTPPEPFAQLPITYETAFGGKEYAQNPVGTGFQPVKDERGESVHWLPNIEDPKQPLRGPRDQPMPASYAPYDFMWPQRYSKVGTYDKKWLETRFPGFAADMDWTIWNAAPVDQWITGFFHGDEEFCLENLHPQKPLLEGSLPGVQARCFINQRTPQGEQFREIPMRLETVCLFPHAERGVLLFRGVTEVAEDDAADILQLVAACENLGEPRAAEHYYHVLQLRLDRKQGSIQALRDSDLMPDRPGVTAPSEEIAEMDALVRTEGLKRRNFRRRGELAREEACKKLRERGLDPERYLPPRPPEPAEPPRDLDKLPEFIAQVRADAQAQKAAALAKKTEAEAAARVQLAARGLDYDKMVADTRAKAGGPPRLPKADIAKARAMIEKLQSTGAADPKLQERLTQLTTQLASTEEKVLRAYRKHAHFFPPAPPLGAGEATRLRQEVATAHAAKQSLARRDLTGADLTGLDLRGVDLREALLEGALLIRCDLTGADLSGAVLARADLTGAQLSQAKLVGATLGSAKLHDARLEGADLTGAVLLKADLTGACFRGAQLQRAKLMEAIFVRTDFREVRGSELLFLKSDLSEMQAGAADLSKAKFLETVLTAADFSGANLTGATFVGVQGERTSFRGAGLNNVRLVKDSVLTRADFSDTCMEHATLRGTNLSGSNFARANLDSSDLSECNLRDAQLQQVKARDSLLVRADLEGADLTGADLRQAILQKANLRGATLIGVNLFRADLARVRSNELTRLQSANLTQARLLPRHVDAAR